MNGSGVTTPSSNGAGNVSCSSDCKTESQQFFIIPFAEDTNIYTIQSVAFPGVYLRMDGTGMTEYTQPGGGSVNCQFGVSDLEKFKIVYNGGKFAGMFFIESKAFPFVCLRTDGGRNLVNCQYGALDWEMYTIRSVSEN